MEAALKERIREILLPVLSRLGLEVFEIERAGKALRVILDREEGTVGIDDCAQVSAFLSHALDVEDLIRGAYHLEVSSPGLDRPIRSLDEFRRFIGRLCRLKLVKPDPAGHVIVGRILGADADRIHLEVPGEGERVVPYGNVARARLEVEF
jgi:ribosome maturation factor RimP